MSAFQACRDIESIARGMVKAWAADQDWIVGIEDVADDINTQIADGDFWVHTDEGGRYSVELKAEAKHTGNLFLEVWSNKKIHRRGWLYTSGADELWYLFLDTKKMYCFRLDRLREIVPLLKNQRLAAQQKYRQDNETEGLLVPIRDLLKVTGGTGVDLAA